MLITELYSSGYKIANEDVELGSIITGNKIRDDFESIKNIIETEKKGYNQLLVRIEKMEVRGPFRNGSFLIEANVYDGTMAMTAKLFANEKIDLKEGSYYAIAGTIQIDDFVKKTVEYVMMVDAIQEWDFEESVNIDNAEVKRVELSTVGAYSQLISSMQGADLIEYAKKIGHDTIAITDINSVQGFPEAYKAAKKHEMNLILGMKLNIVDDTIPIVFNADNCNIFDESYTVFDVETTGFSTVDEFVIEIGATKFDKNGNVLGAFQKFIKAPKPVPEHITELTSITNEEVEEHGEPLEKVMKEFHEFWQGTVLVAHNAQFDKDHLETSYIRAGMEVPKFIMLDTLLLSRAINPELKLHGLKQLSKHYKVTLNSHHRADQDAQATGEMLFHMLKQMKERKKEELNLTENDEVIITFNEINKKYMVHGYHKGFFSGDCTILVQNQKGVENLYNIVSLSHSDFIGRTPMLPLSELHKYREGLLIGSGSQDGRLFDLALNKPIEQVYRLARFFDYIEIEPSDMSSNMAIRNKVTSMECINRAWRDIVSVAKELEKPIVATGYVHYLTKEDRIAQHILMYNELAGRKHFARRGHQDDLHGYKHLRTTEEMLNDITYIENEEEKYEYVVTNTNKIAALCEKVQPIPDGLFPPIVPDANERLEKESLAKAHELYGEVLPDIVSKRLDKELKSIIGNGFAVIYTISADLVRKSNQDGYLVGSRGSVGSSFVATMMGITEVNPLKPHYGCKNCHWTIFFDHEEIQSGYDLPLEFSKFFDNTMYGESARKYVFEQFTEEFGPELAMEVLKNNPKKCCPRCKQETIFKDGQDIPFETFLGFEGDKVPDIDLNFSDEYQSTAHGFVGENKEVFGLNEVYRAGTIGTVAEKTAYGFVKKYLEGHTEETEYEGYKWTNAEIVRVANKIAGAKRTTGQHAGGIIVVPKGQKLNYFGGSQYPAHNLDAQYKTTHYAFEHIHDSLCKLDILGHNDPTILRLLRDSTGVNPQDIDPTDEKVLKLFYQPEEALQIDMSQLNAKTGTLSVPEFGTEFVQQMIVDTKPKTFAELVKISGLSHGTDVWLNNAQELIKDNVCQFKEIIGCRDDIMVYLSQKGLDDSLAFKIMEGVRKGKGIPEDWQQEMRAKNVPEWYIQSCLKIKYMFPKAHAAAYVLSALRIAYYKVYYPIQFYAAVISVRQPDLDVREVTRALEKVFARMKELEQIIETKKKTGQTTKVEADMLLYLKSIHEAQLRGVEFDAVDIFESSANRWKIRDNKILPPFVSVPALGSEAAIKAEERQKNGVPRSIEQFKKETSISATSILVLKEMGCFKLIETIETTFF